MNPLDSSSNTDNFTKQIPQMSSTNRIVEIFLKLFDAQTVFFFVILCSLKLTAVKSPKVLQRMQFVAFAVFLISAIYVVGLLCYHYADVLGTTVNDFEHYLDSGLLKPVFWFLSLNFVTFMSEVVQGVWKFVYEGYVQHIFSATDEEKTLKQYRYVHGIMVNSSAIRPYWISH
jgi:hypothetical protein